MGFKKTLLLTACVVMILGTAISETLAYYQSNNKATTAVNSAVQPEPTKQDGTPKKIAVERVFSGQNGGEVQMLPGVTVMQDITISNYSEESLYVWYTYSFPKAIVEANIVTITDYLNGDWEHLAKELHGDYYIYTCLYKNPLENGHSVSVTGAQSFMTDITVGYDNANGKYYKKDTDGDKVYLDDVQLEYNIEVKAYGYSATDIANVNIAYAAYSPNNEQGTETSAQ